jgi:hypothetical protein
MAVQLQGNGGTVADVGGTVFRGQHAHVKPLEYGALGHYRSAVRFVMTAAQAANSRLWQIRNTSSNLIIPSRLRVGILPAGTVTASYRMELDIFKLTSFTAVDTTNTVTPTASVRRTSTMGAAPGNAAIRHLTVAGNASGMTGGTLTKDGGALGMMQAWVSTAAATTMPVVNEFFDEVHHTHPLALAANEGLLLESIVAGSATANVVDVWVDFSWAEVTAF